MLGKIWGQEEKGATEDEMVGWHHRPNELEFEQTSGDSERQGSLACCSSWGLKQLDMTLWLNNSDNKASQVVRVVQNPPARAGDARHEFKPWVGKISWRRKWQTIFHFLQSTPVSLPEKFDGQRSWAGYSPQGCKELDMHEHAPKWYICHSERASVSILLST